jgi:tRNA G18 (ribose-2'-O)-methylase SpoU
VDRVIAIDDPADPRVAPYAQVRERDLVGREGRFIAEGEVVLRLLARAKRHRALSVLIDEKRLAGLAAILAEFPEDVPIYAARQPVMDALVGFHIHRGILALGERARPEDPDALLARLPENALVLALVGIGNHDNLGGLFRNAAAFGADAVLLDAGCCDPLYRKAIRVSVGAALITPTARLTPGADLVTTLERHGFTPLALSPRGETPLGALRRPKRAAVVLGAEGPGLSEALMARARTVSIPIASGFDSLNVAVTGALVLHHLRFVAGAD